MTYLEWIEKNGLKSEWIRYRFHHLGISQNRALRSFCLKHDCPFALSRRIGEKNLQETIKIAKTPWLDV